MSSNKEKRPPLASKQINLIVTDRKTSQRPSVKADVVPVSRAVGVRGKNEKFEFDKANSIVTPGKTYRGFNSNNNRSQSSSNTRSNLNFAPVKKMENSLVGTNTAGKFTNSVKNTPSFRAQKFNNNISVSKKNVPSWQKSESNFQRGGTPNSQYGRDRNSSFQRGDNKVIGQTNLHSAKRPLPQQNWRTGATTTTGGRNYVDRKNSPRLGAGATKPFVHQPRYNEPGFIPFYKRMAISNKEKPRVARKKFYARKDKLPTFSPFHAKAFANSAYMPLLLTSRVSSKQKGTLLNKLHLHSGLDYDPTNRARVRSRVKLPPFPFTTARRLTLGNKLLHAHRVTKSTKKLLVDQVFNEKNFYKNFSRRLSKEGLIRYQKFAAAMLRVGKKDRKLARSSFKKFISQAGFPHVPKRLRLAPSKLLEFSKKLVKEWKVARATRTKIRSTLKRHRTLLVSSPALCAKAEVICKQQDAQVLNLKKRLASASRSRLLPSLGVLTKFADTGAIKGDLAYDTMVDVSPAHKIYGIKDPNSNAYVEILKKRDPRNWKKKKYYRWRKTFKRLTDYQVNYFGFTLPQDIHDRNVELLNYDRYKLGYPGLLKYFSKPSRFLSSVSGANNPSTGPRPALEKARRLLKWSERFARALNPVQGLISSIRQVKDVKTGKLCRGVVWNRPVLQHYTKKFFEFFRQAVPLRALPINLRIKDLYRDRASLPLSTLFLKGSSKSGFTYLPRALVAHLSESAKIALGVVPTASRQLLNEFNLYHPLLARNPGKSFGPLALQSLSNYQYVRPRFMAALSYSLNSFAKLDCYFRTLWATYQRLNSPVRSMQRSNLLVVRSAVSFFQNLPSVFLNIFFNIRYSRIVKTFYKDLNQQFYRTSEGYIVRYPILVKFAALFSFSSVLKDRRGLFLQFLGSLGYLKADPEKLGELTEEDKKLVANFKLDVYDEKAIVNGYFSRLATKNPRLGGVTAVASDQTSYFYGKLEYSRRQRELKLAGRPCEQMNPEHAIVAVTPSVLEPKTAAVSVISKAALFEPLPMSARPFRRIFSFLSSRAYAGLNQVTFYRYILDLREKRRKYLADRLTTPITSFPTLRQEKSTLAIFRRKYEKKLDRVTKFLTPVLRSLGNASYRAQVAKSRTLASYFSPRHKIFGLAKIYRLITRRGQVVKPYEFSFKKLLSWGRRVNRDRFSARFPRVLFYLGMLTGRSIYAKVMWQNLLSQGRFIKRRIVKRVLLSSIWKKARVISLASLRSIRGLVRLRKFLGRRKLVPTIKYLLRKIMLPRDSVFLRLARKQLRAVSTLSKLSLTRNSVRKTRFKRKIFHSKYLVQWNTLKLRPVNVFHVTAVEKLLAELRALGFKYNGSKTQITILEGLLDKLRTLALPTVAEKAKMAKIRAAERLDRWRQQNPELAKQQAERAELAKQQQSTRVEAYDRADVKEIQRGDMTLRNWRSHEYFVTMKEEDAAEAARRAAWEARNPGKQYYPRPKFGQYNNTKRSDFSQSHKNPRNNSSPAPVHKTSTTSK